MTPSEECDGLKRVIAEFLSEAYLPRLMAERMEQALESKPDPLIMAQAVEGAKAKVRRIIEQIPNLTSQAFFLRVPGPEFLEFLLLSEYILQNSVNGEKGALRYTRKSREPAGHTLARCLNGLGFFDPSDLEPYRRAVRDGPQGEDVWARMVTSLQQYPEEK